MFMHLHRQNLQVCVSEITWKKITITNMISVANSGKSSLIVGTPNEIMEWDMNLIVDAVTLYKTKNTIRGKYLTKIENLL